MNNIFVHLIKKDNLNKEIVVKQYVIKNSWIDFS